MKFDYGCIGEVLKHSFSKEIHNKLADYNYELIEVARDDFNRFCTDREFKAINVTIPYKELIIPHLSWIDPIAKKIGAVNTVVNKDGKLYGYNTDFYGMSLLIEHAKIDLKNKKVVILGTGGTSKTAYEVASSMGAREILKVSREKKENVITYGELYESHTDTEVIINTTPVGTYPNIFNSPLDLAPFTSLLGVIDAVYNPLRTPLITEAKKKGVSAEGGLYMLVAQAVRASEIFTDRKYDTGTVESIFKSIYSKKENVVLTGMPACGKSTVGKIIAKELNREFIDTDILIEKAEGKTIPEIFSQYGEKHFRDVEERLIKSIAAEAGKVIATGGGAILREANVDALKENGKIFFIDRPLESLMPTSDRPLASDRDAIKKRYTERYEIYRNTADVAVDANADAVTVSQRIMKEFSI